MRRSIYPLLLAVALAGGPLRSSAQEAGIAPEAVAPAAHPEPLLPAAPRARPVAARRMPASAEVNPTVDLSAQGRPSKAPYIWTGALVGAGIAAVGFMLDDSPDAILEEVVIAIVVPASALVGAGLGWMVYEIRH